MARKHLWSGSLFKTTVQGKFFKKPDAKCLIFFKKNSKIQNNFSDLLATSVAVKTPLQTIFWKVQTFTAAVIVSVKAEIKQNT